jgi:predicted nucleic acid-binding protein
MTTAIDGRRMTTSIDTNIIVALWDADDTLHRAAREVLDAALGRGSLVICGAVHAELLAAPGRTEAFVDRFCEDTGIAVEWELGEKVWRAAGAAFQSYAARRRKLRNVEAVLQGGQRSRRRILTDFVIGAHAFVSEYTLLTLDAGIYQASFPKLKIATA